MHLEYIAHRINTIAELEDLPHDYGVELDLRDDFSGRVYIQHNPFLVGEDFEEYLKHYHHGMMILNVKSERIEYKVLDLVKKYGVKRYFFLDSTFPMIKTLSDKGVREIAVRYSELEGMDTLRAMQGRVDWVWADCFTRLPLTRASYSELKEMGYRICLVSPELEGQPEKIEIYKEQLEREQIVVDAVCTKVYNISRWQ